MNQMAVMILKFILVMGTSGNCGSKFDNGDLVGEIGIAVGGSFVWLESR